MNKYIILDLSWLITDLYPRVSTWNRNHQNVKIRLMSLIRFGLLEVAGERFMLARVESASSTCRVVRGGLKWMVKFGNEGSTATHRLAD